MQSQNQSKNLQFVGISIIYSKGENLNALFLFEGNCIIIYGRFSPPQKIYGCFCVFFPLF